MVFSASFYHRTISIRDRHAVGFALTWNRPNSHTCFLQHPVGDFEIFHPTFWDVVNRWIDDFLDACLNEGTSTAGTWWPGHIGRVAFEGDTDSGGVHNCILFCVAYQGVFFCPVRESFLVVTDATWKTIEASGSDFSVFTNNDASHLRGRVFAPPGKVQG